MGHIFNEQTLFEGDSNPLTAQHTCSVGTTVLILTISSMSSAPMPNPVTYNGIPGCPRTMVKHEWYYGGYFAIYYLLDPPTGVEYTISLPNASNGYLYCTLASFTSSSGKSFFHTFNEAMGSEVISQKPYADGALIVSTLWDMAQAIDEFPVPNHELMRITRQEDVGWYSPIYHGAQYELQEIAGETTHTWTNLTGNFCTLMAITFQVREYPGHRFNEQTLFDGWGWPSLSGSHECSVGTTVLVLIVTGMNYPPGPYDPPATYYGIAMVRCEFSWYGLAGMYYLLNPPSGEAHDISVPIQPLQHLYCTVASFTSSSGVSLFHTFNEAIGSGEISQTPNVDGALIVSALYASGTDDPPAPNHKLMRITRENTGPYHGAQYELQEIAGETTHTWTNLIGVGNTCMAVTFQLGAGPSSTMFIPWIHGEIL